MEEGKAPFLTERIRSIRAKSPTANDEATLSRIERYGFETLTVMASSVSPTWTYTTGIFDTLAQPEVITIGLRPDTASAAMTGAFEALQGGTDLRLGRHKNIIGNVECEFRPVARAWVKHLMHSANWYYGDEEFPVLQLIYPDVENRFPEDPGFNDYFAQPLLQSAEHTGKRESEFWDAMDSESRLGKWRFSDPPNIDAFLSQAVSDGAEPVTYVSHDKDDGAWQFLGDSMSQDKPPVLVCLRHPIEGDPTLSDLADLPLGWHAERQSLGTPWTRHNDENVAADE